MKTYQFVAKSVQDTEKLGAAFSYVANWARHNYNPLTLKSIFAKAKSAKTLVIGIYAQQGTGKSTFYAALTGALTTNQPHEETSHIVSYTDHPSKPAWKNINLPNERTQYRIYDSYFCGPFLIPSQYPTLSSGIPPIPSREFSGIDFVEHADRVPQNILACWILMDQLSDGARFITITLPNRMARSAAVQEKFLPAVGEFAFP